MTASLFCDDGGGLIGAKIFVGRQAGVPENTERQGKLRRLKLRQQEAQAGIGIRFVVNQQIGFIGAARSKCHYLGAEPFQPLASFFDEVDHDLLIARVKRRVKDVRAIQLVRAYLNAGVMLGGLVQATSKGTPQGGPLSPLLSNILLDDLDRELEKRGHAFCRYADDCNLYVASRRSGERVMAALIGYLEGALKLKVNRAKSAVDRPVNRVFLGYSFTAQKDAKIRVPQKSCQKIREKLRPLWRAARGRNVPRFIRETLNPRLRGWINYFRLSQTKGFAEELDGWIRRRLRAIVWRQWRKPRTRYRRLRAAGLDEARARASAGNGRGAWYNAGASHLHAALPAKAFAQMGLISLLATLQSAQARPSV